MWGRREPPCSGDKMGECLWTGVREELSQVAEAWSMEVTFQNDGPRIIHGPVNVQVGIVPREPPGVGGGILRSKLEDDLAIIGEGAVAMREAGRDQDLAPPVWVEFCLDVPSEGRRALAQIDVDVQEAPGGDLNQLGLSVGR